MRAEVDQATGGGAVGAMGNAARSLCPTPRADWPEGVTAIARTVATSPSTRAIVRTPGDEGLEAVAPELSAPPAADRDADLLRLGKPIAPRTVTPAEPVVLADGVGPERGIHLPLAPGSRLPAHGGAVGRGAAAAQGFTGEAPRARPEAAP